MADSCDGPRMFAHDLQKKSFEELSDELASGKPSTAHYTIVLNEFARRTHIAQIDSANATKMTAIWTRWIAVANLVLMVAAVVTLVLALNAPQT